MSLPSTGEVTRLTVLSFLSAGPLHGYGLREVMESWHMEKWADIRYGSIYQALATMAKDGFVEAVSSGPDGRRPPKTVYRITETGREELRRLLCRAWSEPSRYVEPINVALSFVSLDLLDAEEIAKLLEHRMERLEDLSVELCAEEQQALERSDDPGLRAALTDHFQHFLQLLETEKRWTAHVRDRASSGAYRLGARRTS